MRRVGRVSRNVVVIVPLYLEEEGLMVHWQPYVSILALNLSYCKLQTLKRDISRAPEGKQTEQNGIGITQKLREKMRRVRGDVLSQ